MDKTIESWWVHLKSFLVHNTCDIWGRNIWPCHNVKAELIVVAVKGTEARAIFHTENSILIFFFCLANKQLIAKEKAIGVVFNTIKRTIYGYTTCHR
jgi:hypothetical protein